MLFTKNTISQQLNFDYYNKSNGLLNNHVNCIAQGSEGFMYFGTPSGLSVFDGSSFTNYDASKGLIQNTILDVKEIHKDEFSLLTGTGCYYYFSKNKLHADSTSPLISLKKFCSNSPINGYVSAVEGEYNYTNGKVAKLPVDKGKGFYGINCSAVWRDSLLIVGRSYESLDIYNIHTWKLVASSDEKIFARDIYIDDDKNAWIASIGRGMLKLTFSAIRGIKITFETLPRQFKPVLQAEFRTITQDKQKDLWMGGINVGLIKYNPGTGAFMQITTEQGLISNTIFSVFCDREDNIWIGTNRGVQKLVHKNLFNYDAKHGLPADAVLDVLPLSHQRIITSGYSGVGYITNLSKKAISWKPPLDDEYFTSLINVQNKHFGLSLRKLIELNISEGTISARKIYPLPEHFRSAVVFDNNYLLLGGDSGIFMFYDSKLVLLTRENVDHLSCMTLDHNNILWTGSLENKIASYKLLYSGKNLVATLISNNVLKINKSQDFIQSIVIKDGFAFCGSSQTGINVEKLSNDKGEPQKPINITCGLSNNDVYFLWWYNDSVLLAGTSDGLDKIIFRSIPDSFSVYSITRYYGLSNSVYSAKQDSLGNILLASEAGLIIIPSIDIEHKTSKSLPITISSVRVPAYPDSVFDIDKVITLPYSANNISIFFASLSFRNEKNIKYTYVLQGGSGEHWSHPSTAGSVEFSNLSPGHYHFMVKPIDLYGNISGSLASADIVVLPAFWQTWWFYLISLAIIAGIVYTLLKRRIVQIRKELNFKNKIAETEMMALRSQMNPHFIFNCMNIIDGFITNNKKEEAKDFLQKFSKLIRIVLENSRRQLVSLEQEMQALKLYVMLEHTRFNRHFTFNLTIEEDLLNENCKIPPMLLQPYVENAIVHGLRNKEYGQAHLNVIIKKDDDTIVAIIEDNGIGRTRSDLLNTDNKKIKQHFGMILTEKRIDLIGDIYNKNANVTITDISNDVDTGTRVIITLPGNI